MTGRIQDADLKSLAEVSSKSSLPNDSKIYISSFNRDLTLDEVLLQRKIDGSPLKLHAASTPDSKLYFESNIIDTLEGQALVSPPIKNQIQSVVASTIDFQTGLTTGASFNMVIPTGTVGFFRQAGFSLLSSGVIQVLFSNEAATIPALSNPGSLFSKGAIPIGYIQLECTNVLGFYKTAGSATNIIENIVSGNSRIFIFGSGGSGGSGSDSTKEPAQGFSLLIDDSVSVPADDSESILDSTKTNAQFSAFAELFQLSCDKTKTVTTVGTSFALSGAPSWNIVAGDIIYSGNSFRRIASVLTASTGTLDISFAVNLTAASCMVSQAVWTKDLINYAGSATELVRPRDLFPSETISVSHLEYNDSLLIDDNVTDISQQARIVVLSTSEGLQTDVTFPTSDKWAQTYYERPIAPTPIPDLGMPLNASMERLFLCFIPNPDNVSVIDSANLLDYNISIYSDVGPTLANVKDSAFCYTDSSVTPINCDQPTVFGGKTRISLGFSFDTTVHQGKTTGELNILLSGSKLPKFVTGVTTGDWWSPVTGFSNLIELSQDFSASNFSVEIERKTNDTDGFVNGLRLDALYDAVVGSASQVTAGGAQFSSLTTALAAIPAGGNILLLKGSYTENIIIDKQCNIDGQGRGSIINGTLQITTNSDYSSLNKLKFGGNITIDAGATGNVLLGFWLGSGFTMTDNGTDSLVLGVTE